MSRKVEAHTKEAIKGEEGKATGGKPPVVGEKSGPAHRLLQDEPFL